MTRDSGDAAMVDRIARRVASRVRARRVRHRAALAVGVALSIAAALHLLVPRPSGPGDPPSPSVERVARPSSDADRASDDAIRSEVAPVAVPGARMPSASGLAAPIITASLVREVREDWSSYLRVLDEWDVRTSSAAALDVLAASGDRHALDRALEQIRASGSVDLRARAIEIIARRSLRDAVANYFSSARALGATGLDVDADVDDGIAADLDGDVDADVVELTRRVWPVLTASRGHALASAMPGDAPIAVLAAIGTMRDHESRKLLEALVARRGADAAVTAALGADGSDWALDVLERWARFGDERGARAMTAIANVPGERPLAWLLDRAGELERIPAELVLEQKAIVDIALRQRRDPLFALVSSRIDDSVAREADLLVSARLFPERFVAELGPLAGVSGPSIDAMLCRALARASTPEAIALLIQGLERPALRVEARRALGKLRGRDLGPDPRAWQRWHRDVVAPGASMPLHGDRDPAPAPGLARKHILENRIHARADSLLLRAAARPVHRSPS